MVPPLASDQCKTREMLKGRLRSELQVYGDAITVLQKYSKAALAELDGPDKNFRKAQELAEHARLAYQSARQKLEDHIAAHGCG
jgi:hypothetical protein